VAANSCLIHGNRLLGGDFMPRGRTKTVTNVIPPLIPGQRLPAPPELSPEQAAIWDRIVGSLPQGWITDSTAPLMKELCRHTDFGDRLSRDIDRAQSELTALTVEAAAAEGADARKVEARRRKAQSYFALMRLHKLQSDAIGRLSTKLRLSQLSRYTRSAELSAIAARNSPTAPEPWTDWKNDDGGRRQ
jgi:hypothetical protein